MPVVDEVSSTAQSFSSPLEKTAPSALEDGKPKVALTKSNGAMSTHSKGIHMHKSRTFERATLCCLFLNLFVAFVASRPSDILLHFEFINACVLFIIS